MLATPGATHDRLVRSADRRVWSACGRQHRVVRRRLEHAIGRRWRAPQPSGRALTLWAHDRCGRRGFRWHEIRRSGTARRHHRATVASDREGGSHCASWWRVAGSGGGGDVGTACEVKGAVVVDFEPHDLRVAVVVLALGAGQVPVALGVVLADDLDRLKVLVADVGVDVVNKEVLTGPPLVGVGADDQDGRVGEYVAGGVSSAHDGTESLGPSLVLLGHGSSGRVGTDAGACGDCVQAAAMTRSC